LVVVGAVEAAGTFLAFVVTIRAANAAKRAAEIADRSLHLLNQPWLDTTDWKVDATYGKSTPDEYGSYTQELIALTVSFNVINTSLTPATIYEIEVTDIGSGSPPESWIVSSTVGNLITPGGRHPHEAVINAAHMVDRQIEEYVSNRGFVVEIRGVIHFSDLFTADSVRKRHFGRQCILKSKGSEFRPVAGAERIEAPQKHGQSNQHNAPVT
jgi:hypothetical protein